MNIVDKSEYIFQWLFHQKSNLIKIDPFWSILIHSDPFGTDLVQSEQKIYKVENLMIYFNDYLIRNQMWSSLIKFDPFWTDLIQSDQKKIEDWKSDDIFQWLFHQKLKMWKKWKIWGKRLQMWEKHFKSFR